MVSNSVLSYMLCMEFSTVKLLWMGLEEPSTMGNLIFHKIKLNKIGTGKKKNQFLKKSVFIEILVDA